MHNNHFNHNSLITFKIYKYLKIIQDFTNKSYTNLIIIIFFHNLKIAIIWLCKYVSFLFNMKLLSKLVFNAIILKNLIYKMKLHK